MSKAGASRKRGTSIVLVGSPSKSPIKIPLNDDAQEKAKRLQSRQALHDIQFNQIKAAASPVRRLANFDRASSSSPPSNPKTPRRIGKENDFDAGLIKLGGSAVTPMKRVPLLANFEEWMKMATDNKINATNSWNFALIDYFHDLSLLKEGDSVNFQKASCTLDGCVKIYTSRVDSVATETGKLLSGLADSSNNKSKKTENINGEESEEEAEDEEGVIRKRTKKRSQRSCDATLANSFEALRLKKFELEFSVDPLFKKASADFDEGGAKGLLLNHLSIDCQGRIVFDSSDDAVEAFNESLTSGQGDTSVKGSNRSELKLSIGTAITAEPNVHENEDIDISSLGARFFPNLDVLDDQDICPSLKNFDLGDASSNLTKIPFLKAPEEWRSEKEKSSSRKESFNGSVLSIADDHQNSLDYEDNDGLMGNFVDTGFGEGGEAWARDACVDASNRVHDMGLGYESVVGGDCEDTDARSSFNFIAPLDSSRKLQAEHDDILSYFDEGLQKNWAGPEHWRIRKIKDTNKLIRIPKAKKEKELFEIDFSSQLNANLSELIFTQASSNNVISLPKRERRNKNKNLLPDDKHFSSKQLLGLFLKPTKRFGSHQIGLIARSSHQIEIDENINEPFWAQPKENNSLIGAEIHSNYDANFFQDNEIPTIEDSDDDRAEYMDAQANLSTCIGEDKVVDTTGIVEYGINHDNEGAFGNHLITQNRRQRPDYVQFARVAKKVDVRKLKEELWKGINCDLTQTVKHQTSGRLPTPDEETCMEAGTSLKFSSIMKGLQNVYPKQDMSEISTSYCFICLLHLANEKGLVIQKNEELTDLEIMRDKTIAVIAGS